MLLVFYARLKPMKKVFIFLFVVSYLLFKISVPVYAACDTVRDGNSTCINHPVDCLYITGSGECCEEQSQCSSPPPNSPVQSSKCNSNCSNNCTSSCVGTPDGYSCQVYQVPRGLGNTCCCYPPSSPPSWLPSNGTGGGIKPSPCLADTDPEGGIQTALGCIPTKDPTKFVGWLLKIAIGLGGGIAFLLIVFGAFQVITSSGNPESVKKGTEMITAAISGLIFIIFSLFLLKLIGVNILNIPGFGTP